MTIPLPHCVPRRDKNVNHRRVFVIGRNINRGNKKRHFQSQSSKRSRRRSQRMRICAHRDGGLIKGRAALEKLYVALFAARFEDARVTVASPADNRYRGANVAATRPSTARGGRKKTPLRLRRGDSCKMVWVVASPRTVVRVR